MFGQEINVHISPLGVSPASKQATFYVCKKLISPFLNKWERNFHDCPNSQQLLLIIVWHACNLFFSREILFFYY